MKKSWIVLLAAMPLVVVASVLVWQSAGDDRRQGALGEGDAVALTWRGDWEEASEYATGNVVSYEGGSYVAETEKLSTPMPGCADCGWTQLALESAPEESAPEETSKEPTEQLSGYEIVTGQLAVPVGSSTATTTVNCPSGKKAFGGGAWATYVTFGGPVGPGTPFPNGGVYGWRFGAEYAGGGATLTVSVICANAG